MVYVTSVGPIDLATGQVVKGSITEQSRQVIRNLRQKLEAPNAVGSLIANEQGIGYRLIGTHQP